MAKKVVYKYTIDFNNPSDIYTIPMPAFAEILSFDVQHGHGQIWALCDVGSRGIGIRRFRLAGTGHEITEDILKFIGTVQLMNGALVFHLFEIV